MTDFAELSLNGYIYKVLKQVHPDTGITGDSLVSVNNLMKIILDMIMRNVDILLVNSRHKMKKKKNAETEGAKSKKSKLPVKKLTARDVETGVLLTLPGELAKHAVSEGRKATEKYTEYIINNPAKKGTKTAPVGKSVKAGIQFPVMRITKSMVSLSASEQKSATSGVFMAAVLEYLCAELLELSGNALAGDGGGKKKVRITPRSILLGIRNDSELEELFRSVILSGGVLPNIDSRIVKKGKKRASKGEGASEGDTASAPVGDSNKVVKPKKKRAPPSVAKKPKPSVSKKAK